MAAVQHPATEPQAQAIEPCVGTYRAAAHGDWPVKPAPPFVPGHEGVGIVVETASDVAEVAVGDRVAMPWLGYACGTCDHCVSGWETLCLEQQNMGYSIDGSFGEYAVAYGRYVVKVPGAIDPFDAAPLTCAGVTTYKAVKVVGTRKELREVFELHAAGRTHVIRETRSLDDVNEAMADLDAGRALARIVLQP
jgi:D-arabinose 1-dehydrogenase-like Zn-dependent alcohol dehydrogenase